VCVDLPNRAIAAANILQTCSRLLPNSPNFWDPDTLTYRFLAEAKRLWELEDDEPKLTTVHAGCLINAAMDVNGHDKPGIAYARKAVSIAQELGIFRAPLTDDPKLCDAKASLRGDYPLG
jgi:hypothetical protein